MRLALAAVLAAFLCSPASAHDQLGNPNWISNGHFKNPNGGEHCCGIADCTEVDKDDVSEVRGGYSLRGVVTYGVGRGSTHQWLDEVVPHREVQNSRDGLYWRCKKPDGTRRCFFAPPPAM